MRTYTLYASRPGGYLNWPGSTVTSVNRIGVVVRVMFKRWFGRSPDRWVWQVDGFMAGAKDKRGNEILMEQINRDMRPIALLPPKCGGAA